MAYSIKCNLCNQKFRWEPLKGYPSHCECCGEYIGTDRPDDEIVMPSFLSAKTKANDKLYRDMEKGSEQRMHLAAEAVGASASEMASLKITDLKDNMREGDIAEKSASEAMNRLKTSTKTPVGFVENGAAAYSDAASGAIMLNGQMVGRTEPRAGARAVERVQRAMGR